MSMELYVAKLSKSIMLNHCHNQYARCALTAFNVGDRKAPQTQGMSAEKVPRA